MRCFSPITISDPRYPGEAIYLTVPCRKCAACLQNRRNDWARRLIGESYNSVYSYFITLTYAVEPPTYQPNHVKAFIDSLRKSDARLRYFISGERGETKNRVHYHCIIFSDCLDDPNIILLCWPHGFLSISGVTPGRCGYVCKYCIPTPGRPEYFFRVSRKPAIGQPLTDIYERYVANTGRSVIHQNGVQNPISRYNRRKLKERDVFTVPDDQFNNDYANYLRQLEEKYPSSFDRDSEIKLRQDAFSKKFFSKIKNK